MRVYPVQKNNQVWLGYHIPAGDQQPTPAIVGGQASASIASTTQQNRTERISFRGVGRFAGYHSDNDKITDYAWLISTYNSACNIVNNIVLTEPCAFGIYPLCYPLLAFKYYFNERKLPWFVHAIIFAILYIVPYVNIASVILNFLLFFVFIQAYIIKASNGNKVPNLFLNMLYDSDNSILGTYINRFMEMTIESIDTLTTNISARTSLLSFYQNRYHQLVSTQSVQANVASHEILAYGLQVIKFMVYGDIYRDFANGFPQALFVHIAHCAVNLLFTIIMSQLVFK